METIDFKRYLKYLERMLGEDFLVQTGFYQLEDKPRQAVLMQFVDVISTRIGKALAGLLQTRDQKQQMEKLLQDPDSALANYEQLTKLLPETTEIISQKIADFKQELLASL